jgi:hypothetical protein
MEDNSFTKNQRHRLRLKAKKANTLVETSKSSDLTEDKPVLKSVSFTNTPVKSSITLDALSTTDEVYTSRVLEGVNAKNVVKKLTYLETFNLLNSLRIKVKQLYKDEPEFKNLLLSEKLERCINYIDASNTDLFYYHRQTYNDIISHKIKNKSKLEKVLTTPRVEPVEPKTESKKKKKKEKVDKLKGLTILSVDEAVNMLDNVRRVVKRMYFNDDSFKKLPVSEKLELCNKYVDNSTNILAQYKALYSDIVLLNRYHSKEEIKSAIKLLAETKSVKLDKNSDVALCKQDEGKLPKEESEFIDKINNETKDILPDTIPEAIINGTPLDTYVENDNVVKKDSKQDSKKDTSMLSASEELTVDAIIKMADDLWNTVKTYVKNNPSFKDRPDKEKLSLFRDKFGFSKFMEEYPIVARYSICMGQYRSAALRRVLEKTRTMVHPPAGERAKGYMEDQWVRRQADYVQYLWEGYHKGHYNTAERNWVYQETYKRLKGEFDDFRDMHKEVETKVAEEKKSLAGRNVRDLLLRLKSGKQSLSAEEQQYLQYELKNILVKVAYNKVMKQLLEKVKLVEHTVSGEGTGIDSQSKITMIETVDVNRMSEIDDQYRPKELRGMEPVAEGDEIEDILEEEYEEIDGTEDDTIVKPVVVELLN